VKIREARVDDVEAIHSLITYYAELDRMLFCSPADIYERLQTFKVAEQDGMVTGCCAMQVVWEDLAEIKSLAVDKEFAGKGAGRALVQAGIETARELGVRSVFTLTLEPGFFEKIGFVRIPRESLPMKVWSDCTRCPKQDHCDEMAMKYALD
jgi:amino-acid N-acetyltransferase